MKTILITGVGSPGTFGVLSALQNIFMTVGTDCNAIVAGRELVDHFELVPKATEENEVVFIEKMIRIVHHYKVDVIITQVSSELPIFARAKKFFKDVGCDVLVQDEESISILDNKFSLYEHLKNHSTVLNFCVPEYKLVTNFIDLKNACGEFGYPEKEVVVKLPVSNGSRGFRIISADPFVRGEFLNKPSSPRIRLNDFVSILDDTMPELLVMEYLPGPEYSVDCFAIDGTPIIIFPRIRTKIVDGISFESLGHNHHTIIRDCAKIIKHFKMNHMFGFQFKLTEKGSPKLIECNPRTHGSMLLGTQCNANVVLEAVKHALGKDHNLSQNDIIFDRRLVRYWGGVVI